MSVPQPHSPAVRLLFFWTGILATFAYRLIIVLNHYTAVGVKIAWYVGTVGFIVYFSHRYLVSQRRAKLITERGLIEKVGRLKSLSPEDRLAMDYLFRSLESSKEKWNYVFIFIMSGLSLVFGIVLDLA